MEHTARITDIKRFAVHDGPGIRTTLFLKGCPLRCIWCHNPEGIDRKAQMAYYAHQCIECAECVRVCRVGAQVCTENGHVFERVNCIGCARCQEVCLGEAMKHYGRCMTVKEAAEALLEDRAFYGETGGVTLSGGEPLLQAGFAAQLLERMKAEGIHTAVDTCGSVDFKAFEAVLPYTDMFLYDIKHMDAQRHRALTGRDNEAILRNIVRLCELGARIEVRMPLVPGCNDACEHINQVGRFLGQLHIERMCVLPYHAMARSKYRALGMTDTLPDVMSPSDEQIALVVAQLRDYGVPAVSGREA